EVPEEKENEETAVHEAAEDASSDPVRLYLQEMGAVPLLDRAGEVVLAEQLERGQAEVYLALADQPGLLIQLLRLHESGLEEIAQAADALEGIEVRIDGKPKTRVDRSLGVFKKVADIGKELRKVQEQLEKTKVTSSRRGTL